MKRRVPILVFVLAFEFSVIAKLKIAIWGDSRGNGQDACTKIANVLNHVVTDWDFQIHTGDYTQGGTAGAWTEALARPGLQQLFEKDKFFMCTSNHDCVLSPYGSFTKGILPANDVNNKTWFYHQVVDGKTERVHLFACDRYFTTSTMMANYLQSELAGIDPDEWIIGFWHNPCYGDITYKGSYLGKCQDWLDKFNAAGGDFILHGHAHTYTRTHVLNPAGRVVAEGKSDLVSQKDPGGMVHIVQGLGGAGMAHSDPGGDPSTTKVAYALSGGARPSITFLTLDGNKATVKTVDASTTSLDVDDQWTWTQAWREVGPPPPPLDPVLVSATNVSVEAGEAFGYGIHYNNLPTSGVSYSYIKRPLWLNTMGDSVFGTVPVEANTRVDTLRPVLKLNDQPVDTPMILISIKAASVVAAYNAKETRGLDKLSLLEVAARAIRILVYLHKPSEFEVHLYDITGRSIWHCAGKSPEPGVHEIFINPMELRLREGAYFACLSSSNGQVVQRLWY